MTTPAENQPRGGDRPPVIGLTGAIGSGKSTALAALERLGAATLSSDAVVHELYMSDEVRDAVVARWGAEVAPGGVVDRTQIAAKAFATPEDRAWLEGFIWPLVRERTADFRREAPGRDPEPRAVVLEIPLLFESGQDDAFDHTLVIATEDSLRRDRVTARGDSAVEEREKRQLSAAEKAERADFVVQNDGDPDALERKLSDLLGTLGRP